MPRILHPSIDVYTYEHNISSSSAMSISTADEIKNNGIESNIDTRVERLEINCQGYHDMNEYLKELYAICAQFRMS